MGIHSLRRTPKDYPTEKGSPDSIVTLDFTI